MADDVVLWHLPISHYNEKVRWALDWKGVEHGRRETPPGAHMLVAAARTRGQHKTFPMLRLDGRTIGDSTAIIAALEERYPEPPLYPADPDERRRALALEDFFDEELAPHARLLAFHHAVRDPEVVASVGADYLPARLRESRVARGAFGAFASAFVKLRYSVSSDERAELAERKILAGLDRLEAELGDGDYLVGDRFSVADLTAASLFYPLVGPSEAPALPDATPDYERFLVSIAERPGYAWVAEMFRRHRKGANVAAGAGV